MPLSDFDDVNGTADEFAWVICAGDAVVERLSFIRNWSQMKLELSACARSG